jgi:DDE superfamily endonuclease
MAVSSPPFYTKYVHLPRASEATPSSILNNPKFFPFFQNALGGMDGTHINCCPSAAERDHDGCWNRKGGLSQNCLACCSFDLRFLYLVSSWEGSAADGALFSNSRFTDLTIPNGKFYLADAGFGACDSLLVPYHGVCYHLAEWGRANIR